VASLSRNIADDRVLATAIAVLIPPDGINSITGTMKMMFRFVAVLAVGLLLSVGSASAITLGQINNFQDGTTQGWETGQFATPVANISSGGPAGLGDRYIRLTADGSGSGGRLVGYNFADWTGNYLAAGVNAIRISLNNQSAVSLSIRIAFQSEIVQGGPGYLSQAMVLAPNSGWQTFTIALAPGSLIAVNNPTAYNTFFTNVAWTRIIHSVGTGNLNGDFVTGQLGIDNITAVPEPSTAALGVAGVLAFGVAIARRKLRAAKR
jgi:hypothetical protein